MKQMREARGSRLVRAGSHRVRLSLRPRASERADAGLWCCVAKRMRCPLTWPDDASFTRPLILLHPPPGGGEGTYPGVRCRALMGISAGNKAQDMQTTTLYPLSIQRHNSGLFHTENVHGVSWQLQVDAMFVNLFTTTQRNLCQDNPAPSSMDPRYRYGTS